jgi:hypothetical protein
MKIVEIIESNVYSLKTGKQVTPVAVSMKQAFGHPIANDIEDLGVHFIEKPDYWEDLDSEPAVDNLVMRKVANYLQQRGLELKTYSAQQLYGKMPGGPTATVIHMPEETIFVVDVQGHKFLANRHGANTYIRNWTKIA